MILQLSKEEKQHHFSLPGKKQYDHMRANLALQMCNHQMHLCTGFSMIEKSFLHTAMIFQSGKSITRSLLRTGYTAFNNLRSVNVSSFQK